MDGSLHDALAALAAWVAAHPHGLLSGAALLALGCAVAGAVFGRNEGWRAEPVRRLRRRCAPSPTRSRLRRRFRLPPRRPRGCASGCAAPATRSSAVSAGSSAAAASTTRCSVSSRSCCCTRTWACARPKSCSNACAATDAAARRRRSARSCVPRSRRSSRAWTPVPASRCRGKPHVILVLGVNGSGKTTTIGKLAARHAAVGRSVLLGAGDTFRAAAIEQLQVWGERVGCEVVAGQAGRRPVGRRVRHREGGGGARRGRRDHRHRRAPADEEAADGGARQARGA